MGVGVCVIAIKFLTGEKSHHIIFILMIINY